MNKIKDFILALAIFLLLSGFALAMPASARDSSSSDSHQTASSDSSPDDSLNPTDPASKKDSVKDLAEQFREQAKQKVQAARQNAKAHTEAERMRSCNARKTALTKRMSSAVRNADNLKGVMDRMFTKLQAFYTNKNLNVSDYASLKGAVETAQTNAQANIDALSSLDVSVDCTSQTVADNVSAFQAAVGSTRDSLKDYRKALVDLINSLKGASTGANSTGTTDTSANSGSQ